MSDDAPPSSSPDDGEAPPVAKVIPLAGRRRRAQDRLPTEQAMLRQLTRADAISAPPANEIQIEPEAGWSNLRTDLERQDLDNRIAVAERDLARGDGDAARILRALRSLRAMRSFERGDHSAAFDEWQALIDEDPQSDALLVRATFFGQVKELDTALDDYDRAAALWPNNPEIYRHRGLCFVRRGDYERALPNFRRLVQLRPRDISARSWLASSLRFTGDLDAAIRVIGRAIELAPWRADLYESRAGFFMAQRKYAEELLDLDRCIERDPRNATALRRRASLYSRLNDEDREFADLSRAIEIDPTHAGTFQSRAYRYKSRGQLDLAIADLSRAIEIEPDSAVFLQSRAEVCLKTGAFDVALADLEQVIALERWPEAETLWLRGHAHRKLGDTKSALDDYERAMLYDSDLFDELVSSADTNRILKRKAEHLDDLDVLLLIDPSIPEHFVERAELLAASGDYKKALADLDRAIELDPDQSAVFHARADVRRGLGDYSVAVEDESRAIALEPDVAKYHSCRGIYRALGDGPSDEAEADILHARDLAPRSITILFYQAWYLEIAERWEEAVRVYGRRIELAPDMALLHRQCGEARLHLPRTEATLRAALADFDAAIERDPTHLKAFKGRAEVHALLGDEEAARADRERARAGGGLI